MIAASEKSGAKLMIAYRLRFEVATIEALETVRSGKIGEPGEMVHAAPPEEGGR